MIFFYVSSNRCLAWRVKFLISSKSTLGGLMEKGRLFQNLEEGAYWRGVLN